MEQIVIADAPPERETEAQYLARLLQEYPGVPRWALRRHIRTTENLAKPGKATKRRPRPVHLVKEQGSFVNALYGAVETTGRMPVVRPPQPEEDGETRQ